MGVYIPTLQSIKQDVYSILETDGVHKASRIFNYLMSVLIIINVIVVMLETVQGIHIQFVQEFLVIDIFSVVVFTIEYILRLWVSTLHTKYQAPIFGRIRFALTPYAIIDLLAILPFYIPLVIPIDLRFLRELRLIRIVRILKLGRYSESLQLFEEVLAKKKEDIIVAICILLMVLIIASSLMYYAEHDAQPQKFSSIPHAMWWGVVTLATIGYGDMYPITPLGQFIGGIVVLIGIGVFALPTAILASGFIEVIDFRKNQEDLICCPHCGMALSRSEQSEKKDKTKQIENNKKPESNTKE